MSTDSSNGNEVKPGLKIDRVFSDANVHPFDQITWARRTAEIKDEKGNYVFKQENLEFPEAWSQLAVNVVGSKYLYGESANGNGSPADGRREFSAKQLISRVADTIAGWGYLDGYLSTRDDEALFRDELTWLLINQYAAFNSPVWFNVGLWQKYKVKGSYDGYYFDIDTGKPEPVPVDLAYKHPAGSACFILGVEDSIPSIYERVATEGRIFKYGSGCGTNNSSIRSSREVVSGGGKPSGPLSFMTVYDAVAKVTKSGGKVRRAAKMEILDDWHPDILEFIRCKGHEEAKAHALIREGYESNFNGEAYTTVCFQNSNMSVRFSDAFMAKVDGTDPDKNWQTKAVTTGTEFNARGDRMPAYDVDMLIGEVAAGTWRCGDPGVHFTDTIQKWHTCKNTAPIYASNPCSEFLFLNQTACNLASLNLLKFVDADGLFDYERFEAAVRIVFIAQEILVDRAGYPTAEICQNSHDYRPLGLGYCNLGALLMQAGLAYDSDDARSYAAVITAIMHGRANLTSIELAEVQGPFAGYEKNRDSFINVMNEHHDYASCIDEGVPEVGSLKEHANELWSEIYSRGSKSGFRNAQATLLAPTGTIAFLMDADTTGIEPDIALVKYKQLAGRGMLKIVNQSVGPALRNLLYDDSAIHAIISYIDSHDTIEGAPFLKAEHLPVFDCAFAAEKGVRSISWKGHIDMMAAVQPFLSGAISKTCNVPESFTVDDIRDAYIYAWKQGLKCVAIYRENSKASQPLNTKVDDKKEEKAEPVQVPTQRCQPCRERLPETRDSRTHKFEIAGHEGYINVGFYPDGRVGEIFCTISKEGSTISGLMDSWATAISIGLQYGVPLEVFVNKFSHVRFDPSGITRNKNVPFAKSIPDYIARFLGNQFLEGEPQPVQDVPRVAEATTSKPGGQREQFANFQADAPICDTCGSITVRNGSCYRCHNCGASLGCS